jgi:hypothetical protein
VFYEVFAGAGFRIMRGIRRLPLTTTVYYPFRPRHTCSSRSTFTTGDRKMLYWNANSRLAGGMHDLALFSA